MFAGPGAAREEEGLRLNIRQEALDPEENGVILTNVTIPEDNPLSLQDIFMGVRQAFLVSETEEGDFVSIWDGFVDGVATPVEVQQIGEPNRWPKEYVVHFATDDIRFPHDTFEQDEVTMGLGVFPDGVDDVISATYWDTDRFERINERG